MNSELNRVHAYGLNSLEHLERHKNELEHMSRVHVIQGTDCEDILNDALRQIEIAQERLKSRISDSLNETPLTNADSQSRTRFMTEQY